MIWPLFRSTPAASLQRRVLVRWTIVSLRLSSEKNAPESTRALFERGVGEAFGSHRRSEFASSFTKSVFDEFHVTNGSASSRASNVL